MASCEFLNTGYTLSCLDSTPGVKNVYLSNIDYISGFTLSSGNVITGVTMSGAATFYRFQSPKFTASFEETINLNEENGVFSVTPSIAFRLLKRTTTLRDMLLKVGKGKMVAIVENQDGRYWLVGATTPTTPYNDNGLVASEAVLTSGVARDDFAGLNITLTGYQDVPSYEVDSSIVAGIVTL